VKINRKPLAVLMSGAPGSGKSTLARELGEHLRLPVIDKDRLREGALFTIGADDIDHAPPGHALFYTALEDLLACSISLIGDMTLVRGVNEPDIAARIAPNATLINVHCRTPDAVTRFEARMRVDPVNQHRVDALLPYVEELQEQLFEPLDLGCPCVVVDTTEGFSPQVEEIAAEISRQYVTSREPSVPSGPSPD
jgi:predicted kinase